MRSYLAADHSYARVAQLLALRAARRLDEHRADCGTRFLGQCTCDIFTAGRVVRDWVRQGGCNNGIEGQAVPYGRDYIMRTVGDYYGLSHFPPAMREHFGIRELWYDDRSDV